VTEARDAQRQFYPLAERLADPAVTRPGDAGADLLHSLREDLLRHVGAPLADDAALLLAGAADVRERPRLAGVAAVSGQPAS
jgi:hypothetical protein